MRSSVPQNLTTKLFALGILTGCLIFTMSSPASAIDPGQCDTFYKACVRDCGAPPNVDQICYEGCRFEYPDCPPIYN
jgi:hypothetical protein